MWNIICMGDAYIYMGRNHEVAYNLQRYNKAHTENSGTLYA